MVPSAALVFKLEQTFLQVSVDYAKVHEVISREERSQGATPTPNSIASRMLALKKRMKRKAYEEMRLKAESVAEGQESQALGGAQMLPGVVKALQAVRDTGWWVVAASDLGKKAATEFLKQKALSQYMNLVVARSRLDEDLSLAVRLRPVKSRLKTLAGSVYFCNSSLGVTEAKSLGMKCFVLPSPVEPFRTLYQAEPSGIILSLEEIPQLLALPTMRLPEPAPEATTRGVGGPRPTKVAKN